MDRKKSMYQRVLIIALIILFSSISIGSAQDKADQTDSATTVTQSFDKLKSSVDKAKELVQSLSDSLKKGLKGAESVDKEYAEMENQLKSLSDSLKPESEMMKDMKDNIDQMVKNKNDAHAKFESAKNENDMKFWKDITSQWEERIKTANAFKDQIKKNRGLIEEKMMWLSDHKDKVKALHLLGLNDKIIAQMGDLADELNEIVKALDVIKSEIPGEESLLPAG